MPLDLPEPDRRPLARSPLQLVVWQVRYEPVPRASEARVALAVHESLGGREGPFAKMEPLQNLNITLGPQPFSQATANGWRLTSSSGDWTAQLLGDQASLETTAYETWEGTFRERLFGLVDAVTDELQPQTFNRVGLRYVDRITEPPVETALEWSRYLNPEFLGLVMHEVLGPGVVATQQQVDLDAGDDKRATVRHGFFRDQLQAGKLTYVLDFDMYREGIAEWDATAIKALADDLNELALRIFQQTVTSEMLDYLRSDDDD